MCIYSKIACFYRRLLFATISFQSRPFLDRNKKAPVKTTGGYSLLIAWISHQRDLRLTTYRMLIHFYQQQQRKSAKHRRIHDGFSQLVF
jgi:hypothetical protein